jgi:hypothetical protein
MAEGIEEITTSLQAMKDGSGDFEAVRAAVEAAQFDARPIWTQGDPVDYAKTPGSFEDAVTPWHMRKVISREQWRELRDIWKAKPMPELEV